MGPRKEKENQNIQVFVRMRPMNDSEKKQGCFSVADVDAKRREVSIKEKPSATAQSKNFTYDNVFGPHSKQIDVYKSVAGPVIEEVLQGYNCTIFAYGQTGTGKTFSMEGERSADPGISWENDPLAGIVPRAMHQLFDRLEKQGIEFSVRVSYLELYNEELFDLLNNSMDALRLKIYEDATKKGSIVIHGLEEVVVRTKSDVYTILEQGSAKRQTAATLMNAHSSRSHCVFMVTVHMKENTIDGEELLKTGKLNLVDLAGSENIGRSGAVDKRAREAGNINQSLLTLGRVITALVEHAPHVPYRESKLTRLLQDSLGGRTKTSLIATISPASSNLDETLSTLEYAQRAKNITNRPEVNQKLTKKMLMKEYTDEIERLRRDLLASREKNGIFLAQENYEEMQTQLLQRKDKIKELEEKLQMLNMDMIKVQELFSETKQELEERTEELTVTSKELEDTTSNLKRTKTVLRATAQVRDEQKHLVACHVKTEKVLYSDANKLLHTSDTATSDVAGLHAKLDRKRAVETHNEVTTEGFQQLFQRNIVNLNDKLTTHTAEQVELCQAMNTGLASVLGQRVSELDSVCERMTSMVDCLRSRTEAEESTMNQNVEHADSWRESLKEHCQKTKESEVAAITSFWSDQFLQTMTHLQGMLQENKETLQKTSQLLKEQMASQQELIHTHAQQQQAGLEQLQTLVTAHTTRQQDHCETLTRELEQARDSQSSVDQDVLSKLIEVEKMSKSLQAAISCHGEKAASQNTLLLENIHHVQHQQVGEFQAQAVRQIGELSSQSVEHDSTYQLKSGEHNAASEASIQHLLGTTESCRQTQERVQSETAAFTETRSAEWSAHNSRVVDMVSRHTEAVRDGVKMQHSQTDELVAECATTVDELKSTLREQHTQYEAVTNQQTAGLVQQADGISDWSESMSHDLDGRLEDVKRFLDDEMKKDMPTGTTPQRRDFRYPRVLNKTDPHDKLLVSFREQYKLEEATSTPLPEDSYSEENSVNSSTVQQAGERQDEEELMAPPIGDNGELEECDKGCETKGSKSSLEVGGETVVNEAANLSNVSSISNASDVAPVVDENTEPETEIIIKPANSQEDVSEMKENLNNSKQPSSSKKRAFKQPALPISKTTPRNSRTTTPNNKVSTPTNRSRSSTPKAKSRLPLRSANSEKK